MEIAPGVHRIESRLGKRLLYQYLLLGDPVVLVDAGTRRTPEESILPYLTGNGISPEAIELCLVTHGDADHFGGLHALRQAAPRMRVLAHGADVGWIESPERAMVERYDGFRTAHGVSYPAAMLERIRDMMGPPVQVDVSLEGGETIAWSGQSLHVLHTPGHTPGELSLYSERDGWVIVGDAVNGRTQVDAAGVWTAPPVYDSRDDYLASIDKLERLAAGRLWSTHYPPMEGGAATEFLAASRDFVMLADAVARILLESGAPITLDRAIPLADSPLGPFGNPLVVADPLYVHFESLARRGIAKKCTVAGVPAWTVHRGREERQAPPAAA